MGQAMTVDEWPEADRRDMLALLRRLAAECDASTSNRSWSAKVGLASGAVVEPVSVDLGHLPTVVLADRRKRLVYTTLRDIVHIELARGSLIRLEGALGSHRAAEQLDEPEGSQRAGGRL